MGIFELKKIRIPNRRSPLNNSIDNNNNNNNNNNKKEETTYYLCNTQNL